MAEKPLNLAELNQSLRTFLDDSPTAFHACRSIENIFRAAGFERLEEHETWGLKTGQAYYVTRNDSSIISFRLPQPLASHGIHMVGAHTDSPCLKLKPNSLYRSNGYWQLGVEPYGGVLLNPWFDRDLSLAGRVTIQHKSHGLKNILVNLNKAIAIIPSLAIHLDREANKKRNINEQTYLPPIIGLTGETLDLNALLETAIKKEHGTDSLGNIVDFELSLYSIEPAGMVGIEEEFLASARLDNLLSCFIAARAIADSKGNTNQLIVCNDHEEVGSGSAAGARGSFLQDVLRRIAPGNEERLQCIARSLLISTDNAHGIHPNFADKHDSRHGPMLNAGPVIKINANQAYASNSETSAIFKLAAEAANVPIQSFVTRSDMGCGSTIGPLTATALGVRTVDVGLPTFAMHSIRELAGSKDPHYLYQTLGAFFEMTDLNCA
ncbi:MAG: M18 family aminopeptidase [Pseudomonadota bacterium]